jgi:DNA-binding MarR family transcriptional regulator
MRKIVIKKRHSIRKGQVQDLFERLAAQVGPSASLFHAEMIEILETIGDLSLSEVSDRIRAQNSTVTGIIDRMER